MFAISDDGIFQNAHLQITKYRFENTLLKKQHLLRFCWVIYKSWKYKFDVWKVILWNISHTDFQGIFDKKVLFSKTSVVHWIRITSLLRISFLAIWNLDTKSQASRMIFQEMITTVWIVWLKKERSNCSTAVSWLKKSWNWPRKTRSCQCHKLLSFCL